MPKRSINPEGAQPKQEALLTLKQAQQWLSISDSTIRRLVRNGAHPIVRIGGCIRINPEDVRQYIKRQTERITR
jgi:excisionase family DNA binding protein